MFATLDPLTDEEKKRADEKVKEDEMEERRQAMIFREMVKNGADGKRLMKTEKYKVNRFLCESPSSESDFSELDEALLTSFDKGLSIDTINDLYSVFFSEECDSGFITDWNDVEQKRDEIDDWEDLIDDDTSHEQLSFVQEFCAQAGMEVPVLTGIPHKDYTNEALIGLANRCIEIRDNGAEIFFSGCDINYSYISCANYDTIKDGDDYNMVEVYREPNAEICYPVFCSNSRSFLVEFNNGTCVVKEFAGLKTGHYYRDSGHYFYRDEHVIFYKGQGINVENQSRLQSLKGALIDCGGSKYRFSTEKVIDVKVENKKIYLEDNIVVGVSDVQNGNYEYKVSVDGIKSTSPFKVKYHHFHIANRKDYDGLRAQCTHIKNVMRLPTFTRMPCVRHTVKHRRLLSIIKMCYDNKKHTLDHFEVRKQLNKIHAYYDSRCLHNLFLQMGFFYNYGVYYGKYIIKPVKSCAKVKWAGSQCTCDMILLMNYNHKEKG